MSKAGQFVKKHPWEAAGGLAALGLGGAGLAGAGPLAGLLGSGGAGAAAGAAALEGSPSLLGAGLGGASLGADAASAAPAATQLGSLKDYAGRMSGKGLLRGAMGAQKMGIFGAQQSPPPSMGMAPTPVTPPTPTVLPTMAGVGSAPPPGVDPAKWAAYQRWEQQQQFGGMA